MRCGAAGVGASCRLGGCGVGGGGGRCVGRCSALGGGRAGSVQFGFVGGEVVAQGCGDCSRVFFRGWRRGVGHCWGGSGRWRVAWPRCEGAIWELGFEIHPRAGAASGRGRAGALGRQQQLLRGPHLPAGAVRPQPRRQARPASGRLRPAGGRRRASGGGAGAPRRHGRSEHADAQAAPGRRHRREGGVRQGPLQGRHALRHRHRRRRLLVDPPPGRHRPRGRRRRLLRRAHRPARREPVGRGRRALLQEPRPRRVRLPAPQDRGPARPAHPATASRSASAPICSYACSPTVSNGTYARRSRRCCSRTRTSTPPSPSATPWRPRRPAPPSAARRRAAPPSTACRCTASPPCSPTSPRAAAAPCRAKAVPDAPAFDCDTEPTPLQRRAPELVRLFPVDFTR